ncbi:MAG: hypothetical protein ABIK39_03685 [candidate division WOR-3 bacterium]
MRRRKALFFIFPFLALALIFLPGPNGLISALWKSYRIRQNQLKTLHWEAKADTLKEKIKLWQDPDFATKAARRIFEK